MSSSSARRARKRLRISGYLLFALLVSVTGSAILYGEQRQRIDALESELDGYRLYVQNEAESAARDLNTSLVDLQTNLRKLSAAATPAQHARLLFEVRRLSDAAGGALGRLSISHADGRDLEQFLTRTGDYADTLLDSVQSGVLLSAADGEQLTAIGTQCEALCGAINDRLASGLLPMGAVTPDDYYTAEPNADALPAYPSLRYDGPFSESSETAEPKGLPAETVSETRAKDIADRAFPDVTWRFDGRCDAAIAAFDFSGENGETLSVTERGGKLLYWMLPASGDSDEPLTDDALLRLKSSAASYLTGAGFGAMQPTVSVSYAGRAVIGFAAVQNGVVLCADTVQVYVDRVTERVVGLDARGYYAHHTVRRLPAFTLSEQDARDAVSLSLQIASVTPCLLPKCETHEVACYECRGTLGERTYLVYINAATGAEESIRELLRTDSGETLL